VQHMKLFIKNTIAFFLLFIICTFQIIAEDTMKRIIINRDDIVAVYIISFNVLTLIPVDAEYIRKHYETMLEIKSNSAQRIEPILNAIANENSKNVASSIRILIDIINDGRIIESISISDRATFKRISSQLYSETLEILTGI
jgi:hypothetical protein